MAVLAPASGTTVTAPAITTQPVSQSVATGASATFSVVASRGPAPLTYQWKLGGTAISGATNSSYTIASATSANAGSYTVTVTNSAGSVTSSAATLTVTAAATAPSITTQPASQTVAAGSSVSFGVVASWDRPRSHYQWEIRDHRDFRRHGCDLHADQCAIRQRGQLFGHGDQLGRLGHE